MFLSIILLIHIVIPTLLASPVSRPRLHLGNERIVGGNDASIGQFPYQVSFQEKIFGLSAHFCGGSIIAPGYVVTAAHCVEGSDFTDPPGLRVVAGELDLNIDSGDEVESRIDFIIQHPFYDRITFENDIAILRLNEQLPLNDFIQPLSLPGVNQSFVGETCTVTGWGNTHEGGGPAKHLQFLDLPIVTDSHCRDAYTHDEIKDSMLCAWAEEGGKGSCQGDSGGPLVCDGHLVGVVSWGYGCARPEYPAVYTEVAYFAEWINSHVRF